MKQLYLFVIFILLGISLFAQRTSVKGQVIDSATNQKMIYAGAFLYSCKDSTMQKTEATDALGNFKFDNVGYGEYYVQIYYATYDRWYSEKFLLTSEIKNVDLGPISLVVSKKTLNAAEVVFVKPLFEEKPGKLIMNVDAHPTAAGDNIFELLRKTPRISIDNDETIQMDGKSGVTFLIDGKSSYMSGDDLLNYLKSTPSAVVDRLELMTSPSSKYAAEGAAGMINIVTKREKNTGFNGSVFAGVNASKDWRTNDGFNLNLRLGKVVLAMGYNFSMGARSSSNRSESEYLFNGDTIKLNYNAEDDELWATTGLTQSHNYNFSADYYINKKNTIGINYRGGYNTNDRRSETWARVYENSIPDSSYWRNSKNVNSSFRNNFNINYRHDFDSLSNKILEMDLDFAINSSANFSNGSFEYYGGNFDSLWYLQSRNDKNPQGTNVFAFEIDFEDESNNDLTYEFGAKTQLTRSDNRTYNYIDSIFIAERSNHFIYLESITSFFGSLAAKLSKTTSLRTGLRGELSYIKGNLKSSDIKNSQLYFDIFPNVQVTVNLPKKNNLSFIYRMRISRPRYSWLNPFIDISDPLNYVTGNPYLKPQYSHNLMLGYSWNYMLFFNGGFYYKLDDSEYTRYINPETGIRLLMPQNIGKGQGITGNISAQIPIGKWWRMSYYINGSYGVSTFKYADRTETRKTSNASLYTSQSFTFLKNYSVELSAQYQLPTKGVYGKSVSRVNLNVGAKASFLKKKLTVNLSMNDILSSGIWQFDYTYPDGSTAKGFSQWRTRSVNMRISYRFGKQFEMKKKKSRENDTNSRMETGS